MRQGEESADGKVWCCAPQRLAPTMRQQSFLKVVKRLNWMPSLLDAIRLEAIASRLFLV